MLYQRSAGQKAAGTTPDTKLSKDHEEELIFFVLFVGVRVFVVAFFRSRRFSDRP